MQEFFSQDTKEFIRWLNLQWNVEFDCVRQDIEIEGSPERTLSRVVFQAENGSLFLLEKFSKNKLQLRQTVAGAVEFLSQNGLKEAVAYQKSNTGEFLPFFKGACFQLSPFIAGTGVKRPDYLSSAKMGRNLGVFLNRLSKASFQIENQVVLNRFSIKNYIYKLFGDMEKHDPLRVRKFLPFLRFLEQEFMGIHDKLPVCFCHGDLHPLNVIWEKKQIKAVVDWEFAGINADVYDAANLVGCAGIENPNGLGMPMVKTFLKEVCRENLFSDSGWRFFPEYVLALRFAWLSEWLRKKDTQMLEMEEVYMGILTDNMDVLRQGWGIV